MDLFFQGKLKYREHLTNGFDKMPEAFFGLFTGENTGRLLWRSRTSSSYWNIFICKTQLITDLFILNKMKFSIVEEIVNNNQWRIQDSPEEGRQPPGGGANL